MKIKMDNIEFVSFSDGVCDIYSEDEEGTKTYKYKSLGFTNRVLGYNRAFAAQAVQVKANAVIRIPQLRNIDTHDTVEVKDIGKYDVELVQNIFDTNPPSVDLTLRQLEMFGVVT
mgnify:CR=1 FL=1|jgi:hypothetical protein